MGSKHGKLQEGKENVPVTDGPLWGRSGVSRTSIRKGYKLQTDPCGVEADTDMGDETPEGELQTDPCGVEAQVESILSPFGNPLQTDPCGVEAGYHHFAVRLTGLQTDPCGVEARTIRRPTRGVRHVTDGPLWGRSDHTKRELDAVTLVTDGPLWGRSCLWVLRCAGRACVTDGPLWGRSRCGVAADVQRRDRYRRTLVGSKLRAG